MMTAKEMQTFIRGRRLNAFDPSTGELVATIEYGIEGTCRLTFTTGESEAGTYQFQNDIYWTTYERFRDGKRNGFRLERLAGDVAQAWNVDGSRAFLQSAMETLPSGIAGRQDP